MSHPIYKVTRFETVGHTPFIYVSTMIANRPLIFDESLLVNSMPR